MKKVDEKSLEVEEDLKLVKRLNFLVAVQGLMTEWKRKDHENYYQNGENIVRQCDQLFHTIGKKIYFLIAKSFFPTVKSSSSISSTTIIASTKEIGADDED
ncbi:uncharacterized protein DS421_11g338220 [Arachis hypogaea]|nr:uncharacterized protein DS421_11g338220 [Arachis hypogaea]